VFLKIDADQARPDVEVEAMAMAPVPTPRILWRRPPVLALAALRGTALGRLQELAYEERLDDVVAGYGTDVDRDLIRAWWSLRCLSNVRWLAEHGFGAPDEFPEVAVLRSVT
jgi:hypothetical protein